ncbi:MAG: PAS domain S-box protein [Nitrospira sp.]|nr:PAS domain S-box protein [Nitrospira sp.]
MNGTLPLVDVLRQQVAHLVRELAERDSVLHERTRHLRVAQGLAHLGSWEWEVESGTVRCSSELCRIFGRELGADLLTFDGFVAAVFPEDRARVMTSINNALGGQASYDLEYRIIRPTGEIRTIHSCAEVLRNDTGKPCRMSGSVLDITERACSEAMLRSSQEKLRQALQASGIGLWDWNTHTNEMALSDEWKRQLGYERTELSDSFETWEGLLHPEDRACAIGYLRDSVREHHEEYRQEYRLRHKDGTYRWIECRAALVTEADGRRIRFLGSHMDITERRRMEQAVRESEDRYRTLVDLSPSGVFVFCEGKTVYVNHRGALLMGVPDASELLDQSMFDFIHPDYHHDVRENARRVLAGNVSVHSAERIYLRKDGTPIPVQMEAARIVWKGTPAMIVLIADVTERKQAEEALRASEERFAKAFKASPHLIVISELETGRLVEVNDAASQLLGYQREEPEGQIISELEVWGPTEEQVRFRDRLKEGSPFRNLEVNLRAGNGDVRRFLLSSELIELKGRPCRVTVGDDITERTRAEDELRRSHVLLRQVIDGLPNFIFAKDRDGRFTIANKAVAECYGTTVSDLIGQTDADFNPHWDEVEFSREKDLQVITSLQECFIPEEKRTDWSGKTRWLQTIKRPIVDEQGRFLMVLGASTDITERKWMEGILLRHEQDLNAALQDRERISQDLHDDVLQSIYAAGLELEACKSKMKRQPELAADYVMEPLEHAIGQLNHVIGKIRTFISGLESHAVQMDDFIADLRTVVQAMCHGSSTQCRVRIDDGAGLHLSAESASHLINIVREALSNALRHSHATRITVSLRQLLGSVRLTVMDNGIGFNPKSVQGVGHGLENMAARAHKAGGVFAVRSEPLRGTRVLLDLPKNSSEYFN